MKIAILTKAFSHGFLGTLALGVALGLTPSANASTVNKGTDYLITPNGGATYNFGGSIGQVSFSGLPIGGTSGIADTVVNRLDSISAPYLTTLPVSTLIAGSLPASNVTRIQIVGLSLAAEGSYAGKIFVGLDPSKVSGGEMAIAHNSSGDVGGIWSSYFGINGMAIIANTGVTLTPSGEDYISGLISNCGSAMDYLCLPFAKGFEDFSITPINLIGGSVGPIAGSGGSFKAEDEPWTHLPNPGQITGPNLVSTDPENFYLTGRIVHDAGNPPIHIVDPTAVPGPLPILGASTAFAFARRLRKRCREAVKIS
jgi:hypothetical protein